MKINTLPKVSVIIPAFNEEKYIISALNALIDQEYPFFEIIVTDNDSTDRTAFVIKQFLELHTEIRIPVTLLNEPNKGTNFARECARKAATGSVIAQMDADCIPPKDWISKGVLNLYQGKRVAVTGPYDYFDGNPWMRGFTLVSQRMLYPVTTTLAQLSGRAAILIGGNAFIRADVLEALGGYNTLLTFYGDDVDMGTRLCRHGTVAYIGSLLQFSSSRRYQATGFWQVNKKYQSCFWKLVWQKNILLDTVENSHPR